MAYNPYQQFMQQSVATMTPGQILVKLYEKCEVELNKAVYYIEHKEFENANKAIQKTQKIVETLDSTLKMKYDVSSNLAKLYDFFRHSLVEANIDKDAEKLKSLVPFFTELKEAFAEAEKKVS